MSKTTDIRTERDLAVAAKEALRNDPDFSWRITRAEAGRDQAGAEIHLKIGGREYPFSATFKRKPSFELIDTLAHRVAPTRHPWLLVTPRLTDRFVALCRQAGLACLDLNGRVWISRGPVFIDRATRADGEPVRAAAPEPDLFSPKSSRVVRALLSPRADWSQADLADQTGISRPLLSRLLESLRLQGYVRREGSLRGGRWITAQPDALLDQWARRDDWTRRVTVHQYSLLLPTDQAAGEVANGLGANQRIAFTQWFAAQLRFPYTEAPVISAYVDTLPSDSVLKRLTAREVPSGGRLWLLRPKDEGVFQFTRTVSGLNLVSNAQIYLDLLQVGQRGPDAAKALREWEGFRR